MLSVEQEHPAQFEVVGRAGLRCLPDGGLAAAVSHLDHALGIRPATSAVLNALADSHLKLGHPDEARERFARSLELDPDQPPVRARLEALK